MSNPERWWINQELLKMYDNRVMSPPVVEQKTNRAHCNIYLKEFHHKLEEIRYTRNQTQYVYGRTVYNSSFSKVNSSKCHTQIVIDAEADLKRKHCNPIQKAGPRRCKFEKYSDLDVAAVINEFYLNLLMQTAAQERFFYQTLDAAIAQYLHNYYYGLPYSKRIFFFKLLNEHQECSHFDKLKCFGYDSVVKFNDSEVMYGKRNGEAGYASTFFERQRETMVKNSLAVEFAVNSAVCNEVKKACDFHLELFDYKRLPYTKKFS